MAILLHSSSNWNINEVGLKNNNVTYFTRTENGDNQVGVYSLSSYRANRRTGYFLIYTMKKYTE